MANNKLWRPAYGAKSYPEYRLIKSSEVVMVGDWLVDEGVGMADVDATSELIKGLCVDIVTPEKISLQSLTATTSVAYTGTWAASTLQYTASSTNDDDGGDGIMVAYIRVLPGDQFLATLSAAKTTTVSSGIIEGYFAAILTSDASKIDEATLSTSSSTTQFRIVDRYTQGSTTQVIVEVIKSDWGL